MIKWIKQLFCKHEYIFVSFLVGLQTEKYICKKCSKVKFSDEIYNA